MTTGRVNPKMRLGDMGISDLDAVHYNFDEAALVEEIIRRDEGSLGVGGTVLVSTGKHTGRSPQDKFVVREPSVEDTIWWDNNKPMEPAAFEQLHADMLAHMKGREYFVQDLFAAPYVPPSCR